MKQLSLLQNNLKTIQWIGVSICGLYQMICKDCNQEVYKAVVSIDDILEHPDITLDVDYWIKQSHKKECKGVKT